MIYTNKKLKFYFNHTSIYSSNMAAQKATTKPPISNCDSWKSSCISCPPDVLPGSDYTQETRNTLFGPVAGGAGSSKPEKFQRQKIMDGTALSCSKTNMRINLRTHTLHEIAHPNINEDGFDYSEDFDGIQTIHEKKFYINLKCIVGKGGAQTRSLREVYAFVMGQLHVLQSEKHEGIYFANILDGDEAHHAMSKFTYLLSLPEFESVRNKVYVGDLKGYFDWFTQWFSE